MKNCSNVLVVDQPIFQPFLVALRIRKMLALDIDAGISGENHTVSDFGKSHMVWPIMIRKCRWRHRDYPAGHTCSTIAFISSASASWTSIAARKSANRARANQRKTSARSRIFACSVGLGHAPHPRTANAPNVRATSPGRNSPKNHCATGDAVHSSHSSGFGIMPLPPHRQVRLPQLLAAFCAVAPPAWRAVAALAGEQIAYLCPHLAPPDKCGGQSPLDYAPAGISARCPSPAVPEPFSAHRGPVRDQRQACYHSRE